MGEVAVTVNKRTYRIACGDGEEVRLAALADHVRQRVDTLAAAHGRAGDDRLLLMAALLLADELFELRESLGQVDSSPSTGPGPGEARSERPKSTRRTNAV